MSIDALESGRCMADEAREKLRNLVLRKHVMLKDTVTDDYGRVLAIDAVAMGFTKALGCREN
jgi:endonuclease YncB( thermonuclease family)